MERFRRRTPAEESLGRLERALSGLTTLRKSSPSRTSPSRTSPARSVDTDNEEHPSAQEDFKGRLGLNLLHNVDEPVADFVFVHGLGGGSRKTWSKTTNPQHYWPKEWLSRDPEFADVRVHSFGYKADWGEKTQSILDVQDFARALLAEMQVSPDIRRSNTRIVFIAHSMGGIVVKKAYILAREDPALRELAGRIHTCYFLATPHRGADLAKVLMNVLKVTWGPKPFVADLERNSGMIASVNDSFRHFAPDLQLWSYYETMPSSLVVTNAVIVDKGSATLGYPHERTALLNADHRGICKFDFPTDSNYKTLRNALITTVDAIASEVSRAASRFSKHKYSRLAELTGISEAPIDDLSTMEELKVDGTCEWFTSNSLFDTWQKPLSSSKPIIWLTGNAASGKSVLCGHIVNRLQEQNLRSSYFFFKHGNVAKSTVAGCLRALAYQMAKSNEAVLERLLEAEDDASTWEHWDERTLWRRIMLGSIFKDPCPDPHFWIIDALDECQNFSAFLTFIAKAPPYLRIFISSRHTAEVDQGLMTIKSVVEHYSLRTEDTNDDLALLIDSRIDHLHAEDVDSQSKLKDRILSKASGSFLWVSLVIQELDQVYSEEGAEEALNEVPSDMNDLYARMLESIPKNPRSIRLAKSILTLSLLAFRPLRVNEMQCAIKLDINETIRSPTKSIPQICGQLVCVDQSDRVQNIHLTAKAYLLQQSHQSDLVINKNQGHNRIAQMCLKYLAQTFPRTTRARRTPSVTSVSASGAEFADYACVFWSDHLQKSSSEDASTWKLLCDFLENNVLSWIEYLSKSGKLYYVTRTAKNLRAYLMRRVKYLAPLSPQRGILETWIEDLIRLSTKFRASLTISPSSIHTLIPAMCPSNTIISRLYATRQRTLLLKGLSDKTWDDCIARIDYPAHQTSAVAHGDRYFAVAISDGKIKIYYRESVQLKGIIDHGDRAKILVFSGEDRYLASSSLRCVKVWDPRTKAQLWKFDLSHQALTLLFVNENTGLSAATQGNYLISWNLQDGLEEEQWSWSECLEHNGQTPPRQPPGKALFSPDYACLAVTYRGLPIFLIDVAAGALIGQCSRETVPNARGGGKHYVVDAMAFNPSPEINILIASYGDGELAIYNLWTAELRVRVSSVFAHSLACSPDGRTLLTGSTRGTINIYEFAGAEGENVSLLYTIDAYEDGVRDVAFSSDSLCFADIRGSQCRIWEPAVLVRNDLDEGSQTDLSQAIPLLTKSVGMLEGPPEAEVTAMCCHTGGKFILCGKQDGTVVYFEQSTANERGILYRHAANVAITSIAYSEKSNLVVTADESGRVLVKSVMITNDGCKMLNETHEIRSQESITAILIDPAGTKILVQSKRTTELWSLDKQLNGSPIIVEGIDDGDDNDRVLLCHPTLPEYFIVITRDDIQLYSWMDARKPQPSSAEAFDALELTVTTPTGHRHSLPNNELFGTSDQKPSSEYIATFHSSTVLQSSPSSSTKLGVWAATSILPATPSPLPLPLKDFYNHSNMIRQVIATAGSLLLFLDTNLWVCSLDLVACQTLGKGAIKHFFLLSEWQTSTGRFIIDYQSSSREFVIARKNGLLVVGRGLDFKEPWLVSA